MYPLTKRRRQRSCRSLFLVSVAFGCCTQINAFHPPIIISSVPKHGRSTSHKSLVVEDDIMLTDIPTIRRRKDLEKLFLHPGDFDDEAQRPYSQMNSLQTKSIPINSTDEIDKTQEPGKRFLQENQYHNSSYASNFETRYPRVGMLSKPKRIESTEKGRSGRKAGSRSLSSTMPGMNGFVEPVLTRRTSETSQQRQSRRKINGENMYRNSAAVPESLVQFAELIHREERITQKEEIELGSKTQEAIRLQNLYDSLETKLNRDPTDEEWCAAAGKINMEAIRQTIDEGLIAKNKLVTSNLRMVQSVVNTYIRNGLSAQYNAGDMMQEGIIALIRAAEKFEPDRGWKFSTYAMYWVRASVKRSQIQQSRPVPVPQRLYENHKRLRRIEHELELSTGQKPTRAEVGECVGMSELQVNRCYAAMAQQFFSLDQQLTNNHKPMSGGSKHETLVDIIDSKSVESHRDELYGSFVRENLIETLHRHLSSEEAELLSLRYGLMNVNTTSKSLKGENHILTIAELSTLVDLKPDKVRRMINNSLKHLKTVGLEEYLAFENDM